mmetsp:Transcript_58995/g.120852  ORF Transcript_58995/g.120852 Transcript_58995/m.120852 type:complete len:170 (-) Transcript_58995:677-1186(-)
MVDGINAIHNLLLVHNDLKPSNVLIHAADMSCVTIIDMGMATFAEVGMETYGTQGYRAPEFVTTSTKKCNTAALDAEAWAVGVTALQFTVGRNSLVAKEPTDKDRDCSLRQDYVLAKTPRTKGWVKEYALNIGKQKVIEDVCEGYAFIEMLLQVEPIGRSKALRMFTLK